MNGDQLATLDDDLLDRTLDPVLEALDLDIGEMELRVRVQQIRQPIGPKPNPAEDPALNAVGDEANKWQFRHRVRLEDLLGRALQDEVQAPRR